MIKTQWQRQTQEDFFNNILPLTLLQGFEKVVWGFTVRGSWRPNINCNILTPLLWPSRGLFLVLLMLNRRPRGSLCCVMAFFIASYQHLLRISNSIGVGCGFPNHISSPTVWNSTGNSQQLNWNRNSIQLARRTQLSYIMVQRPLDLWNRMFDRHQAEITVSSSHFISQFPPTRFPLITAIRMCHLLLVHHLGMAFLLGPKVKI